MNRPGLIKKTVLGTIIHAVAFWGALSLGYSSFKEYSRPYAPLTDAMKGAIKGVFPVSVALVAAIYLVFYVFSRQKGIALNAKKYAFLWVISVVAINAYLAGSEKYVIVPVNISFALYPAMIAASTSVPRTISHSVYFTQAGGRIARMIGAERVKAFSGNAALLGAAGFSALLMIAGLLLLAGLEKPAEEIAKIGYLALFAGAVAGVVVKAAEKKRK